MISLNSVLAITTSKTNPTDLLWKNKNIFLYNGESYQGNNLGMNDTEYIHEQIRLNKIFYSDMHLYEGMLAYVIAKEDEIEFSTDYLGEKPLFYHQEKGILIISSTLLAVKDLYVEIYGYQPKLNLVPMYDYLCTRHFLTNEQTIYQGIYKARPGRIYSFNPNCSNLVYRDTYDAYSFIHKDKYFSSSYKEVEEMIIESVYRRFNELNPSKTGSILSGGIDSSLITLLFSKYLKSCGVNKDIMTYSLNFGDKDKSAVLAPKIASLYNFTHKEIVVTADNYAEHLEKTLIQLVQPLPTHSFPSLSILGEVLKDDGMNVVLGGEGADEIYQGYTAYTELREHCQRQSLSPYSYFNEVLMHRIMGLTNTGYTSAISGVYGGLLAKYSIGNFQENVSLSLMLDVLLQLPSTGLFSCDQVLGSYGLEGRSPLVSLPLAMKRIGSKNMYKDVTDGILKRPLKDIMKRNFPEAANIILSLPKQGFSGFPNEAARILLGRNYIKDVSDLLNIDILKLYGETNMKNEAIEWKIMNLAMFIKYCL